MTLPVQRYTRMNLLAKWEALLTSPDDIFLQPPFNCDYDMEIEAAKRAIRACMDDTAEPLARGKKPKQY